MDKSLNMEKHIQKLCQTSIAQLRNIADVRKYLTQNGAEKLIHAFITSRLDYYNSLLYGLPSSSLKKLQQVQNMAAKILTLCQNITHHSHPTGAPLASSGAPHNLQNFTDNTPCSKWQGSSIYHRLINPLHTSAQSPIWRRRVFGCSKNPHKNIRRESLFFRCCCRMEQIAKEVALKQYPQSIQVIHQNLPVHSGFPLIYQYLWNASAKIHF